MSTWQLFSNNEVIDTKQLQTSNYEEAHTYFRLQKNLDTDVIDINAALGVNAKFITLNR